MSGREAALPACFCRAARRLSSRCRSFSSCRCIGGGGELEFRIAVACWLAGARPGEGSRAVCSTSAHPQWDRSHQSPSHQRSDITHRLPLGNLLRQLHHAAQHGARPACRQRSARRHQAGWRTGSSVPTASSEIEADIGRLQRPIQLPPCLIPSQPIPALQAAHLSQRIQVQ